MGVNLTMKIGLGVYQVIWYGQKSIVRGVKHVLTFINFEIGEC